MQRLLIILTTVLISLFLVACASQAEMETMQQAIVNTQATAVTETNLRKTVEVALADQEIEATRMVETAVVQANQLATAEAKNNTLSQRDLAYQLALASTQNLNERPHLIQQSALLTLEAVQRYPDERTVQSLRDALQFLPDYDMRILEKTSEGYGRYKFSENCRFIIDHGDTLHIYDLQTGDHISGIDAPLYHSPKFSQNGKFVAMITTQERILTIWETVMDQKILQIDDFVSNFEFSPSGQFIGVVVRGNEDQISLQVWSVSDEQMVIEVSAHDSFAFSPDEKFVYLINDEGLQKIELTTGFLETFDENPVGSWNQFSPQINYLLTLNFSTGHQIISLDSKETVSLAQTGFGGIFNGVFSPDERFLAGYSQEGGTSGLVYGHDRVYVWDVDTGTLLMELEEMVQGIIFSPDSRFFAISLGSYVSVWETEQFQEIFRLETSASSLTFTPDSKQLLTSGKDGVDRWNLEMTPLELRITQEDGEREIGAAVYSPNGEIVATGGQSGWVHLWNAETGEEFYNFNHGYDISTLSFSPDGKSLLIGSGSLPRTQPIMRLWDVVKETDVLTATFDANVENGSFSPDGDTFSFVTVLYTDTVYIHDMENIDTIYTIEDNGYLSKEYSANGRYLTTSGYDSTGRASASIWGVETGDPVYLTEDNIELFAFSPDNQHLAGAGIALDSQRMIKIWDFVTGEELAQSPIDWEVENLTYSPDGNYLAFSQKYHGDLIVYDTSNWTELINLSLPGTIADLDFTPDSRYLAFTNNDYSLATSDVIIWDIQLNRVIERIVHPKPVYTVEFNPQGTQLLAQSGETNVFLWRWHPDDLIAETCHRLSRNLTPEEWQTHFGDEPYRPTCPNLAN